MLSNEIKRLKMKKIKFENLEKKILKLDTYRRITRKLLSFTLEPVSLCLFSLFGFLGVGVWLFVCTVAIIIIHLRYRGNDWLFR